MQFISQNTFDKMVAREIVRYPDSILHNSKISNNVIIYTAIVIGFLFFLIYPVIADRALSLSPLWELLGIERWLTPRLRLLVVWVVMVLVHEIVHAAAWTLNIKKWCFGYRPPVIAFAFVDKWVTKGHWFFIIIAPFLFWSAVSIYLLFLTGDTPMFVHLMVVNTMFSSIDLVRAAEVLRLPSKHLYYCFYMRPQQ